MKGLTLIGASPVLSIRVLRVHYGWMADETIPIEVVLPDAREIRAFDATSYTVHADGGLDVTLADGSVVNFAMEDWADVRRR